MAETTTYAGTTFPLPASPAGLIVDPIAAMLLDFVGWYFNTMLGPQFALLYPNDGGVPVPSASRYAYDPKDVWPQNSKPALYVAWKSSRSEPKSMLRDRRIDTYELTYIAPGRNEPGGAASTSGLIAVASRALAQAGDRGWHPAYRYGTAPLGEPPHITVGFQGWEVVETMTGMFRPVPSRTPGARLDYYPTLKATIRTYNYVEQPTADDPADALGDSVFAVSTNGQGDLADVILFAQATVVGPDGSEDGDE